MAVEEKEGPREIPAMVHCLRVGVALKEGEAARMETLVERIGDRGSVGCGEDPSGQQHRMR
jgi:hypothetical protein